MNKVLFKILVISFGLMSSAFAADEILFKTIEEARQYCPAENALTYIETWKGDQEPYSMGIVTGYHSNKFSSIAVLPKPMNLDRNNIILDTKFTQVDIIFNELIYGFKSTDNKVNCFYSFLTYGNRELQVWFKD